MAVAPPSSAPARLVPLTTDQLRDALERRRHTLLEASRADDGDGAGPERLGSSARTERALADIDRALARLRMGRYGFCERCGARLSPARLEAAPATRRCVLCS